MKTNKQTKKVFRCSDEIHEYITQILKCFVSFIQGKCVKPARAQSVPLLALRCACTSRRVPAVAPHPLTPPPHHFSPSWRRVVAGHPAVPGLRLQRAARKPPENSANKQHDASKHVNTCAYLEVQRRRWGVRATGSNTHGPLPSKELHLFAGVVFFLVYCYFAAHS